MQPGVYPNLTNEEYHGGPGISKSGLDLIHRSPLHYRAAKTAANDNEPTAAQAIGTAFHSLLLEPESFAQLYCQQLQRSEVPEAIEDRDHLVALVTEINQAREAAFPDAIRDKEQLVVMIQALNADRKPKLPTGGTKAELVDRILNEQPVETYTTEQLEAMKGPELKGIIEQLNGSRLGLLSTNGSTADLAATLRANGAEFVLWSEICEDGEKTTGVPFIGSTSGSRHDMAAWLRANGKPVLLWSDVLASWTEKNAGRTILSDDQFAQLQAMRDAVLEHPMARALLTNRPGVAEHSVYWNDPITGELCRCRPDFWREDDVIVDLKTTDDASPEGFAKSIANWRYDVQDPYYRDGIKLATGRTIKAFVFLAVEKKFPHAVGCYVLDQESIELGRAQYRADLNRFHECRVSANWPGYGDKIQTITLPAWHAKKNEHLLESAQ
jgi:exodeoxyribonuclease VIII